MRAPSLRLTLTPTHPQPHPLPPLEQHCLTAKAIYDYIEELYSDSLGATWREGAKGAVKSVVAQGELVKPRAHGSKYYLPDSPALRKAKAAADEEGESDVVRGGGGGAADAERARPQAAGGQGGCRRQACLWARLGHEGAPRAGAQDGGGQEGGGGHVAARGAHSRSRLRGWMDEEG